METYPPAEARDQPGRLVGPEPRRPRDAADVKEAAAREAAPTGPSMTHDAFMAALEDEDREAESS
ncbi:hypothetical protein ABZ883_27860 [Streptomyces sp. NPDC046977]|uniref:hypothetical protein n=1 Tax=Streptomyces sp. NPDC046977 TaxID=3154703 RepID=UPI0033F08891